MSNTTNTAYIPGVCNINQAEVRKRKLLGYSGIMGLLLLSALLYIAQAPTALWLSISLPTFIAATGLLQAQHKFCVSYASAGMQHTDTVAEQIINDAARTLDKQRARQLNLQAGIIATVVAVCVAGVVFLLHV